MTDEQRLETARQAVWKMLSIAEVLGRPGIDTATIHRAALVPLSSTAAGLAEKLANFMLANVEMLALILAGHYKEGVIADFEAQISRRPVPRPRARRPRPAAAPLIITPDLGPVASDDQP